MARSKDLLVLALGLTLFAPHISAQPIRDSAGIRIVSHQAGARAMATWRIAPTPILEVGGADATGPAEFSHIWGVARTAGGGVVVSDEPAQELRVFDASGKHLRTFGRKGGGPGEFSQIRGVTVYGDTIYALDNVRGTAVFRIDGTLLRQARYPSLGTYHPVDPWGVLADGSTIETAAGRQTREMMLQVGTRIEMRGLFRIARNGDSAALLAIVPTFEFYRASDDPPGGDLLAFAPMMSVAVLADLVCTGRGDRYEIRCMDPAGNLRQIIRRQVDAVPVTEVARDAHRSAVRTPQRGSGEGSQISQSRLDQIAARKHYHETFPVFARIAAGRDGEVWVGEYDYRRALPGRHEPPPSGATVRWNAFAKTGAWIGEVDLPARFVLKAPGRDYVLGVNRDDDGVERVTVYRLLR